MASRASRQQSTVRLVGSHQAKTRRVAQLVGETGDGVEAIANAIFDATGACVRTLPFTPERVKAALG